MRTSVLVGLVFCVAFGIGTLWLVTGHESASSKSNQVTETAMPLVSQPLPTEGSTRPVPKNWEERESQWRDDARAAFTQLRKHPGSDAAIPLAGLKSCRVHWDVDDVFSRYADDIKTRGELILRPHRLITDKAAYPVSPLLVIRIRGIRTSTGVCYFVEIKLDQEAIVRQPTGIGAGYAVTYSDSMLGFAGNQVEQTAVREVVESLLATFANDVLKSNNK